MIPSRGGGCCLNNEPMVQYPYTVRSVMPYHDTDLVPRRNATALLARNMDTPPFHHDEHHHHYNNGVNAAANMHDRFLLSRRLNNSGFLSAVVSDQIDRLHSAARAKTTGFRSTLGPLDGVTKVSSKLQGLSRFDLLVLPTTGEIEAAEREAEARSVVCYPIYPSNFPSLVCRTWLATTHK